MSEITISECIAKLEKFANQIAKEGEGIMKEEVPVGMTGNLKSSVRGEVSGDTVTVTADTPYAQYVQNGRGPIKPHHATGSRKTGRFKKAFLKWNEYQGSQSSIHSRGPDDPMFRRFAGPAKGNDFQDRSKLKLQALIQSIWDSL